MEERRPGSLSRSELLSWHLHCEIADRLAPESLDEWGPALIRTLDQLESSSQGEPHLGNLGQWRAYIDQRDLPSIRTALTGDDRHSVEMREVSPFSGILTEQERLRVLARVRHRA